MESDLLYCWRSSHAGKARAIIFILAIFSIVAWSWIMASKALQMRRAKQLNLLFLLQVRAQKNVLSIFQRRVQVDGCPMFGVYQEGCVELAGRQKSNLSEGRPKSITLTSMEHVKRALERAVAQESLRLESGLIMLAIAVSGATGSWHCWGRCGVS